ncbi:MAG: IS3 family transposase, partial [Orrella sp.]
VTPTERRIAVDIMTGEHQLSKAKACKIVGLSRSALYKARVNWSKRDTPVIVAINKFVTRRTRWGFWKCY